MAKTIGYWIATGLIIASQGFSGFLDLTQGEMVVTGMNGLGYPLYVLTILGVAKLLGVTALAAPKFNRIREWAYAGFTFDFIGAAASHCLNGNSIDLIAPPIVLLVVLAISYFLRPNDRRLVPKHS